MRREGARLQHADNVCGKVESGALRESCRSSRAERFARKQMGNEHRAARWQVADKDFEAGPRYQRIFRFGRLDPADRAVASVRREYGDGREARTHDPRCRMRHKYRLRERFGRYRRQCPGSQRLRVGSVIGVKPGSLDSRDISQPRHRPRIFIAFDEIGKVAAIFEQKRRIGRCGADMEARHRAKEILPGDALRRRKTGCQRIDQTDGNVVAVYGVTPGCRLPFRPRDQGGRSTVGIEQSGGECRGVVESAADICRLELNRRHRPDPAHHCPHGGRGSPVPRLLPHAAPASRESRCPTRRESGWVRTGR
jgi:hypothetical protein